MGRYIFFTEGKIKNDRKCKEKRNPPRKSEGISETYEGRKKKKEQQEKRVKKRMRKYI